MEKFLQMKTAWHQKKPRGAIGGKVGRAQDNGGGHVEPPAPLGAQEELQLPGPQPSCVRSSSQTETDINLQFQGTHSRGDQKESQEINPVGVRQRGENRGCCR